MKRIIVMLGLIISICILVTNAQALPVTVNMRAEVTSVSNDYGLMPAGSFAVGDIVTGSYTYNTDTPDHAPNPAIGAYSHSAPPYGVSLYLNGYFFGTNPASTVLNMYIFNDYSSGTDIIDKYGFESYNCIFDIAKSVTYIDGMILLDLYDSTATKLSSIDLTSVPPTIGGWNQNSLQFHLICDEGSIVINSRVISLETASPVPEPVTAMLLIIGLAGAAGFMRKRKMYQ